jgi:hypothetical protein
MVLLFFAAPCCASIVRKWRRKVHLTSPLTGEKTFRNGQGIMCAKGNQHCSQHRRRRLQHSSRPAATTTHSTNNLTTTVPSNINPLPAGPYLPTSLCLLERDAHHNSTAELCGNHSTQHSAGALQSQSDSRYACYLRHLVIKVVCWLELCDTIQ